MVERRLWKWHEYLGSHGVDFENEGFWGDSELGR